MSVWLPETLRTSKSLDGLTSITARPTMRVVEGPGGVSVGKRKTTLWPVSCSVNEPRNPNLWCYAYPFLPSIAFRLHGDAPRRSPAAMPPWRDARL